MIKFNKIIYLIIIITLLLPLVISCDASNPAVVDDDPPISVSSYIYDQTDTARYYTFIDGLPRVSATGYYQSVAEQLIPNHQQISKIGFNPDVDTVEEDIWFGGGKYVFPNTDMQMEVVSTSANDTAAGSGAQTVTFQYLDDNWEIQEETVTLNGITAVPTTATNILRVNVFWVTTAGTTGYAEGNISIRHLSDTPLYRTIPAGYTIDQDGVTTIPDGISMYITSATIASGSPVANKFVRWSFRARYNITMDRASDNLMAFYSASTQDGTLDQHFDVPIRIPERTDIVISAVSDQNDSLCSVVLLGWVERN